MELSEPVSVRAELTDDAGQTHIVERFLVSDYKANEDCKATLLVDGKPATDLTGLGMKLSSPPIAAPVLMQHTLRYVMSAKPKDRSDYFKALLDVRDLEEIRTAISDARRSLVEIRDPLLARFAKCAENLNLPELVEWLEKGDPNRNRIDESLGLMLALTLAASGETPDTLEERLEVVRRMLVEKRQTIFPLHAFEVARSIDLRPSDQALWSRLKTLAETNENVETKVAELSQLYNTVLELPSVGDEMDAVDCPVCSTPRALTPERVREIREYVRSAGQIVQVQSDAQEAIQDLVTTVKEVARSLRDASPAFLRWEAARQEGEGFRESVMRELLGEEADGLISPWQDKTTNLGNSLSNARSALSELEQLVSRLSIRQFNRDDLQKIQSAFADLSTAISDASISLTKFIAVQDPLVHSLRSEIDRRNEMVGWQDLIDLANRREGIQESLIKSRARANVIGGVDKAIKQIDEANGEILDQKFSDLSQEIKTWWDLLRPEENSFFTGVERVGTGRRYLDLRAGLSKKSAPATSEPSLRHAVAVFSDSQLNCLGLAAFLARSCREPWGFVILDDPIMASDEDHRAMFVHMVLQELIRGGVQVIMFTYEQSLWRDIQLVYQHENLDVFQLTLPDPEGGTRAEKTSDDFEALMARAEQYIRNNDATIRKIGIRCMRDAAERFCKELLVKNGPAGTSLSSFEGKSLGELEKKAAPFLTGHPSHVGQLASVRKNLNLGSHDAPVPAPATLVMCRGYLRSFKKEYL